jgi:predicted hotdog family 3-hydroxylacyl-ACP dehydratase
MSDAYPPIEDLIPHGYPIRGLDELVDWAPGRATCRLTVHASNPFVREGALPTLALLEYMAQAVAACLGYEAYRGGEGVRVGMLIGVRKMELAADTIPLGSELTITVERSRGNEDVSTFEGITKLLGQRIATAQMTLFHAEKPP